MFALDNRQHTAVQPLCRQGHTAPLTAEYSGLMLHSAFQPIFSLASPQAVGFEALVRPHDGQGVPVSPMLLFDNVMDMDDQIGLDRLCRRLHLDNFSVQAPEDAWLFLNVSPQVCVHGPRHSPFFAEQLQRSGLPPHRVVVEVTENAITDEQALRATVDYYKELGCVIALDDFGTGHSNFSRVWSLQPDIVKLDRSIIQQAATQTRVRRSLPNLVAMLHEAGSLVLAEGVETELEAQLAIEADVDLLQGFLFATPTASTRHAPETTPAQLQDRWRLSGNKNGVSDQRHLQRQRDLMAATTGALADGMCLNDASMALLKEPGLIRTYLLNDEGIQLDEAGTGRQLARLASPKFSPLRQTSQHYGYRRSCFSKAIEQPGQLQWSSPYLSALSSSLCVTLSIAFVRDGRMLVLCCDLDRNTLEQQLASVP